MKNLKVILSAAGLVSGMLANAMPIVPINTMPTIEFNIVDAVVAGSGCDFHASGLYTAGNILVVDGVPLNINLSSHYAALAARKACSIRIPIVIPAGFYIAGARSIDKIRSNRNSSSSNAQARATISLLAGSVSSEVLAFQAPIGSDRVFDVNYTDLSLSYEQLCNGKENETILGINLSATARRNSSYDKVTIQLGASNRNIEIAAFELEACE